MRECFNSLDSDGRGSINVNELDNSLISLGIADDHEQVEKMVQSVDPNKSGAIEFQEFLQIVKNDKPQNKCSI